MSAALQTKTDQAIRTLTPEQLAEYAVREKWADLKALYEKRITEQDAEDRAKAFSKKFLNPMPPREFQTYQQVYERLNRSEETRTAFSVAVGHISDMVAVSQTLLTAIDRLLDVAYKVQGGKTPWPEDLEWTISFSEEIIPVSIWLLEKRKAELKEYMENMADIVTLPPEEEMVKTPQEVRDYLEKKQAGEEYQDDLIDPFDMPRYHLAKRLGVPTEGRTYREVYKAVEVALTACSMEYQDGEDTVDYVPEE